MSFLPYSHFKKVYHAVFVFFLILLIGTLGYVFIEGFSVLDALYMTVITLATVGYAETRPLNEAGQIFTICIILINLGAFTYFLAQVSSYFLDGEFTRTFKLYKMKSTIAELENHIIICGFGRNGQEAARIFHNSGQPFVVIEKTGGQRQDLPFPVAFYLNDDATRDETLLEAGIKNARAVLTTLPDDADNLFVVLTARDLNPRLKIISRASQDSTVKKLKTAGANNVIMPDKIGGVHMATLVLSPDVKEFIDLMATHRNETFSITEVDCTKTLTIQELNAWYATGATVLGIKTANSEFTLNPHSKTVLRPGNKLIAMGSREQLEKLTALLN